MRNHKFNYTLKDSQGTILEPVSPEKFDLERYIDYEASLMETNKKFWESKTGIQVYRRFRSPDVFMEGCRDMKFSLALQLGALKESLKFKGDVANFLEPWYGIGVVASAFGIEYIWKKGATSLVDIGLIGNNPENEAFPRSINNSGTVVGNAVDRIQGTGTFAKAFYYDNQNSRQFVLTINGYKRL